MVLKTNKQTNKCFLSASRPLLLLTRMQTSDLQGGAGHPFWKGGPPPWRVGGEGLLASVAISKHPGCSSARNKGHLPLQVPW